jgi:hypothetical protein
MARIQGFTGFKMENRTMKKQFAKLVLTATLGLAITFTVGICLAMMNGHI